MSDKSTDRSLFEAVVANPEDDQARRDYADYIRPFDPPHAELIDLQLDRARRRRKGASGEYVANEERLIAANQARWLRAVDKYARDWTFYRGFVEEIWVEPGLFLEHGDYIFKLAPIRHVRFLAADGGDDFPVAKLFGSALLERLDSIDLGNQEISDADAPTIASSTHLARCLLLVIKGARLSAHGWRTLASSRQIRRILMLHGGEAAPVPKLVPGDEVDMSGYAPYVYSDPPALAGELEGEHGYIPWLHPEQNSCPRHDARSMVEIGALPVIEPGTPVDRGGTDH